MSMDKALLQPVIERRLHFYVIIIANVMTQAVTAEISLDFGRCQSFLVPMRGVLAFAAFGRVMTAGAGEAADSNV